MRAAFARSLGRMADDGVDVQTIVDLCKLIIAGAVVPAVDRQGAVAYLDAADVSGRSDA